MKNLEALFKIFASSRYVKLLEKLEEKNSISDAAREAKTSYKKAWDILQELRKIFGEKILVTKTDGVDEGGTFLSKKRKEIIQYIVTLNKWSI